MCVLVQNNPPKVPRHVLAGVVVLIMGHNEGPRLPLRVYLATFDDLHTHTHTHTQIYGKSDLSNIVYSGATNYCAGFGP